MRIFLQIHRKNGITHKARRSKIEKANIHSAKSEHSFSESEHSSENEHFYYQRQSVFYSDAYISNTLNVPDIVIPYGMENKLFIFLFFIYLTILEENTTGQSTKH